MYTWSLSKAKNIEDRKISRVRLWFHDRYCHDFMSSILQVITVIFAHGSRGRELSEHRVLYIWRKIWRIFYNAKQIRICMCTNVFFWSLNVSLIITTIYGLPCVHGLPSVHVQSSTVWWSNHNKCILSFKHLSFFMMKFSRPLFLLAF